VDAFRPQKLRDAGVGRGREGGTGRSRGQGRGLGGGDGVDRGVGSGVGLEVDNEEVDGLSVGRGVGQELEGIGPEVGPGRGPEAEDGEVAPDRIPDPFQDQGLDQEVDDNGKIIKSGKNRVPLTFKNIKIGSIQNT